MDSWSAQERTRTLLVECASLLTVQGTEGPPPDIDVTSALIPTMPQAIAAAVAEVRETPRRWNPDAVAGGVAFPVMERRGHSVCDPNPNRRWMTRSTPPI